VRVCSSELTAGTGGGNIPRKSIRKSRPGTSRNSHGVPSPPRRPAAVQELNQVIKALWRVNWPNRSIEHDSGCLLQAHAPARASGAAAGCRVRTSSKYGEPTHRSRHGCRKLHDLSGTLLRVGGARLQRDQVVHRLQRSREGCQRRPHGKARRAGDLMTATQVVQRRAICRYAAAAWSTKARWLDPKGESDR